jgi:GNAT superfamily N-acetyltransferase
MGALIRGEKIESLQFLDIDEAWRQRFAVELGEKAAQHLHFSDGFTISTLSQGRIVGFISAYFRHLPSPLSSLEEGYIDILEVIPSFRRQGIATELIGLATQRIASRGACQVRAWSSQDKLEVLPLWRKLGFGLYPAVVYPRGEEVHGFFAVKVLG